VVSRDHKTFRIPSNKGGSSFLALAINVSMSDGSTHPLLIAYPLTNVDAATARLILVLSLAAGGVIILASLGGYALVQRSLKPLEGIEKVAGQAADGDLSQRAPESDSNTEVGHLAKSFNTMMDQIETSFEAQQRSEKHMRDFVGDASHELRTPLAAIRGYGELYRIGALKSDEDVADAMRRIESEATRMGSLAESLLTLTRLDDSQNLEVRSLDITGMALDALGDLGAIDPSRHTAVLGVDSPGNFTVDGDENRLRQVLTNLVGNVVRYTPEGSPVEIALIPSSARSQGNVVIEIRDHGPGIPPEHAEHIFERFYRVDKSRSRDSGGSGLGLAIVASIIRAHHGTITVVPTQGGGATFRISLPA
jgi:two-component system OmpR family sensor kinase